MRRSCFSIALIRLAQSGWRVRCPEFITADQPGKMDIAFQIMMPGINYDLGHAGKGPSDGWFFFSSYNTECTTESGLTVRFPVFIAHGSVDAFELK